jgi:hypothetical protein
MSTLCQIYFNISRLILLTFGDSGVKIGETGRVLPNLGDLKSVFSEFFASAMLKNSVSEVRKGVSFVNRAIL